MKERVAFPVNVAVKLSEIKYVSVGVAVRSERLGRGVIDLGAVAVQTYDHELVFPDLVYSTVRVLVSVIVWSAVGTVVLVLLLVALSVSVNASESEGDSVHVRVLLFVEVAAR